MHNTPRITGSTDLLLKAANHMAAQVEALPETVATSASPDGLSFSIVPPRVKTAPFLEPPPHVSAAEGVRKLRETTATLAGAMRSLADERLSHCAKLKFAPVSMQQLAKFVAEHVTRHQLQLDRALAPHG